MSNKLFTRVAGKRGRRGSVMAAAAAAVAAGALAGGMHSAAQAAQHVYTPAGTTDQWSAGTNWSSTPVSGANTQLTIVGSNATVIPDGQVSTTNNDIAGNFLLNILDLQGTGPATTDASITISGNTLEFVDSGLTSPTINLNANDGAQDLDYVVTNNLTLSAHTIFDGHGSSSFSFTGSIGGGRALIKRGSSSLFLSGTNTYAGGTTVADGMLRVAQTASLPGYNVAGQVEVNPDGTLAVNAGGAGQWTATDVDTLRANATFNSGSKLGINVDAANTFTYASNIANPIGLTKSGAGTLVLSGTNTYSGATTVTGGTLQSAAAVNLPGYNSPNRVVVTGGSLRLNAGTGFWSSTELDGLAANATFGAGSNLTLDVSDAVAISANLTQSNSLTKTGAGTLSLSGTNTYAGATSLQQGTLAVTNGAQLGSGTLNLGNAANAVTLQTTGAVATITNPTVLIDGNITGPIALNAAGDVEFTGNVKITEANAVLNITSPGLTTFSGPWHTSDNNANRNLRFGGNGNVLISGVISNGTNGAPTGGIGYAGSGKMTLSGNNTFAGTTFVTSGTVSVSSGANLGASRIQWGEAATVASPVLEVTGTGPLTIGNNIFVRTGTAAGGILSAARPIDFTGTMSANTGTALLLINNSSPTTFSGSVAISDGTANRTLRLGGSGDVLVSAPVTNAVPGGTGAGNLGYFGTGTLTLTNNNTGYSGTTTVASGTLAIGNDGALGTGTLNLGSSSSAPATIRAEGGARTIPNSVTLSSSQTNPGIVGGNQAVTLSGSFSNGNSHGYLAVNNAAATTLAGPVFLSNNTANARTLHITGPGDLLISGVVANANGAGQPGAFEHNGAGTVTLTGANTYTGGTNVQSGTLQVRRMHENNPVTITAGKLQVLDSSPTLPLHPSGDNAFVSRPSALTMANNGAALGARTYDGQLDLGNNDLILDYNGASPIADIEDMVRAGFNGGNWLGNGIASSTANANSNFAVGVADNARLTNKYGAARPFSGQTVDDTTILVKFTHRIDLDLDGVITTNDATIFNSNYAEGAPAYWSIGDLDYDRVYTTNDATLFNSFYSEALASVPEPAALGVLAFGALGLLSRRRR